MFQSVEEVLTYLQDESVVFVSVRFTDLPGFQHQFNLPVYAVDEEFFTEGPLFDGSSIRGFVGVAESDMQLIPDITSVYIDPFRKHKTLCIVCSIVNPRTGEPFQRDPRGVAQRAEEHLASTGIADTANFAPEAEFYIFDDVRYQTAPNTSFFEIDSLEAWWNSGRADEGGNLGHKTAAKGGYFPLSPIDKHVELRDEISRALIAVGLDVERSHHEVGAAGQGEINYRFNTLAAAADDLQKFKYVVKNVAHAQGKSATFMPKPVFADSGSGMHCHQSLWNAGEPLFYDEKGYANLSDTARWYIGGLLQHAASVAAFTNPTINSYKRLVKYHEAPVNAVYSQGNRSAAIRIPITGSNQKAKRLEFRAPDPSANPYLAFAAQLMAGLDGIRHRIEPGDPVDKNLYELPPGEAQRLPQMPTSLEEALQALDHDHEFLLAGGVFTEDLIRTWIDYKYQNEILPMSLRINPYEFELYYSV